MNPKKTFLLIFVLITACSENDQTAKINNTFFDKYKNESAGSAIDYLFSTNKWVSESKDDIAKIKADLNDLVKDMGTYYGHELISSKDINKNLKQYIFQLRYDLQPLRIKIIFYKPENEWRVQNFQYDSKLLDE